MKKIIPLIFSVFYSFGLAAQATGGWGTCEFATVVAMNAYDPSGSSMSCKKVFVVATNEHYQWDGSAWVIVSDDQIASEVPFTPAGTISSTDVQAAIEELEPDIYGSIDVHSDVDITTVAPSSGDLLAWDGSNFVPQSTSNGYTIFSIWAEESGSLGTGTIAEWSFGNGNNTATGNGIVIPVDCELFAMSLDHENGVNTTVRIIKNSDSSLSTYQVTNTGTEQGYTTFGTPLAFTAGDVANFITISASTGGTSGRVSAWFRIRSTPAATSLVNDLLDVSAGSITSGQILQYNGASFVPVNMSAENTSYDNSTSGLTATTTQDAIDELAGSSGTDDQVLSLSTDTLSLEDGGSVDLSAFRENLYNTNSTLTGNRTASLANFNLQWDLNGTGDFDILDNGTTAFTVKDNGLVGIGNVTPIAPLHIYEAIGTPASSTNGSIVLEHGDSGGASSIYFKSTVNSGSDYAYIEYSEDGSGNGSTSENGLLTIAIQNDINGNAFQDDIAIMPSGNLGVGTTSPNAKLDVEGGSVRFSDYGTGTYLDAAAPAAATYSLAVDTNGDLVEVNNVKSSKIFYPPALIIDVSTTGNGRTLDLHQQYVNLYGTPAVASSGAPSAIPTYAQDELYYYVTDYDNTIFSDLSISADGILTYDVDTVPVGNCAVFNVVFVVK